MENKDNKKKKGKRICRALLLGAAVVWIFRRFGRRGRRRYARSEKHEYYRFLG